MPRDSARNVEAREWLQKASLDLRAAQHGMTAEPPLTGDVLFHIHQLVEKSLKAFLAWHDQRFRRTHSLVELGGQCVSLSPDLEPLLRRAAPLTEYAWKFRYPGCPEEPSAQEAYEALALGEKIYLTILSRLPEEIRP